MYVTLYNVAFGIDVLLAGLTFGLVGAIAYTYARALRKLSDDVKHVDDAERVLKLRDRYRHVVLVGLSFAWLLGWSIVSLLNTAAAPGSDPTVFAYPLGFVGFLTSPFFLYRTGAVGRADIRFDDVPHTYDASDRSSHSRRRRQQSAIRSRKERTGHPAASRNRSR